jgi:2-polyprenyl-3-methyl-5-hydroxy-6-metoxy-1,4-benzoquinol methylase
MEAYTGFAQVYDIFMDDTPYEEWCGYLTGVLEKYQESGSAGAAGTAVPKTGNNYIIETDDDVIKNNLQQEHNSILDLGCGTGTLTELLARQGYDMIGIDNAQEMLQIAMDKRDESGLDILYLLQDMREFELYGTVGAVISVCDSVNYLLEEEDIVRTFRLVNNYLFPKGIFIFDFNTVYKYAAVIGDATIAENREECSFIWDNYYHEAEQINEYDLTIFVRQKTGEGLYRRFQETHYQRGYELEQMKDFLRQAGLVFLEAIDADTQEAVRNESERIYVVARKGE